MSAEHADSLNPLNQVLVSYDETLGQLDAVRKVS